MRRITVTWHSFTGVRMNHVQALRTTYPSPTTKYNASHDDRDLQSHHDVEATHHLQYFAG
jgi:hypothetical protein